MHITVFGGSFPKPGTPDYQQAYRLGQLIGLGGHSVLTGGYIGTMEAVSRGCAEAGGHVIGVTCDQIEAFRPIAPNQWVQEERRFPTIDQRIAALIDGCDAAFALPGSVGTLTEITIMWNQMQTRSIPARPLILIGPGWQAVFEAMFSQMGEYTPPENRSLLAFALDVEQAYQFLFPQD